MRVWKLTPLLLIVLGVGACSTKPAEQPGTDTSAPPSATNAPEETNAPALEAAPTPAATPAPAAPAARAANTKSSSSTSKDTANAAQAAPVHEAPQTAALRDNTPAPPPTVAPAPAAPAPKKVEPIVIPAGTELNIVLSDPLNSGKNKAGDEFAASLAAPVYVNGATVFERGAKVQGQVLAAEGSGRVSGKASMKIALTGVTYKGKMVPIVTKDVSAEAESSTGRDAKVVGGGAGVGAIIGAIAGGKKGAAIGAAVGGAGGTGAVLATKGKEVDFPTESKLTFTLDKELSVMP